MTGRVPHPGASSASVVATTARGVLLRSGAPHLPAPAPPRTCPPLLSSRMSWTTVAWGPSSANSGGSGRTLLLCLSWASLPSLCRAAFFTNHPDQLPEVASGRAEDSEVDWESRGGRAASVVGLRRQGAQIAGSSRQMGVCPLLSWGGQLHPPTASVRATHGDPASGADGSEAGDAASPGTRPGARPTASLQ